MQCAERHSVLASNRDLVRKILGLAGPIAIGGIVQTVYHIINAWWVGRLGSNAVAVVSICMPINLLLISIGGGLALAGSILIAQNLGARRQDEINKIAAQTIVCLSGFSILLTIAGYILAPQILTLLGVDESIAADTLSFLRVTFASTLVLMLSAVFMAILRGLGDSKAPLPIILTSVVINAALDPLLIFGWGPITAIGVTGAAYATLITQLVTAVAGIKLMLHPRFGLTISLSDLRPDWTMAARLFRLGIPASVEHSMQAVTVSIMMVLVAAFGTVAVAAYGIVFRLYSFLIIPAFSVSVAASILVGQSIGAGSGDLAIRLSRIASLFNFAMMSVIGLIFFIPAESMINFFVPGDMQLVESGSFVLRVFVLSMPLTSVMLTLRSAFRGAGDTFVTMVLTLTGIWLIQIPLAYSMSRPGLLGEFGLWYSTLVATMLNTLITVVYFNSHKWLKKVQH